MLDDPLAGLLTALKAGNRKCTDMLNLLAIFHENTSIERLATQWFQFPQQSIGISQPHPAQRLRKLGETPCPRPAAALPLSKTEHSPNTLLSMRHFTILEYIFQTPPRHSFRPSSPWPEMRDLKQRGKGEGRVCSQPVGKSCAEVGMLGGLGALRG